MSILKIAIGDESFRIDSEKGFDLSIPVRFQGERLSAFGVAEASAETVENEAFVGDTRRDGSCNVQRYTLIPHCHGTHTECVGHLVDEPVFVSNLVMDSWIPATLLTIRGEPAAACFDAYTPEPESYDTLISKAGFDDAIAHYDQADFHEALIVRTLPNELSKTTRRYRSAPYFSNDAMREIAGRAVRHLLVDLPSVDRLEDRGRLSNHRIFWGLPESGHALKHGSLSTRTITELIYVPDEIEDGYYLLNLQVAPFSADAAPSRPVLFELQRQ